MSELYSMKKTCALTGLPYETLKFYCNAGLVPNVKRGKNNYRLFDEQDVRWIKALSCLKDCGMSIAEMQEYLALCLKGESSIPERQRILEEHRRHLLSKIEELQKSIAYIDWKQNFYNDVLSGKIPYRSNLLPR